MNRLDSTTAPEDSRNSADSVRRCQPLLGTYVEIEAAGPGNAIPEAITRAFDAVREVQSLMNVHDPASELSRMNREASRRPFPLHPWTLRVLMAALRLAEESRGAFDPTVSAETSDSRRGTWRDVELRAEGTVVYRRPLRIDFGGIAKGFAVDRALEVLRRHGMKRGWVNAGGDLRGFGCGSRAIHLRHPVLGGVLDEPLVLGNGALATSASTFTHGPRATPGRCGVMDPRTRSALNAARSVTVLAPTCLWADALTKVVWVLGAQAAPVLRRHRARAWILETQ